MSFFIYVASNENKDFFTKNTNAIFKNSVNPPLTLDGDYECALVELITPTMDLSKFKSNTLNEGEKVAEVQNVEIPAVMLIYSSIVQQSALGGSSFPLLRIISTTFTPKSKNTTTSKLFALPFYKKLSASYISEIEISINTQSGSPFPFPAGVSFAVLHVRPVGKNE
jgi:hypothetical protein